MIIPAILIFKDEKLAHKHIRLHSKKDIKEVSNG